jgi:hypothetical protein
MLTAVHPADGLPEGGGRRRPLAEAAADAMKADGVRPETLLVLDEG